MNFYDKYRNKKLDTWHPATPIDSAYWAFNNMFKEAKMPPASASTKKYQIVGNDGPIGNSDHDKNMREMLWKSAIQCDTDTSRLVPEYLAGIYSPGAPPYTKMVIVDSMVQRYALEVVTDEDGFAMNRFELQDMAGYKICDIFTHALGKTTPTFISFFNRLYPCWEKEDGRFTDRSQFEWNDECRNRYDKVFNERMRGVAWGNAELAEQQFSLWFAHIDAAIETYEFGKEVEAVTLKVTDMKEQVAEWKRDGVLCTEAERAFMSLSALLGAPSTPKIARKYLGFFDDMIKKFRSKKECTA